MKVSKYGKNIAAGIMALPLFMFGVNPLIAAEINGVSKITEVMVFPRGAEITRAFSVDLPEGEHQLKINDLPAELQGQSLRIEGAGPEALIIGSIDHKVVTEALSNSEDKAVLAQMKEQLQLLRDEREMAQALVDAAELQKKLLNEMALLPSRPTGRGEVAASDPAQQYASLYSLMGEKFIEAQQKALKAKVELRRLDKEIKNLSRRIAEQPSKKKRASHLTVNVDAGQSGKAEFTIKYQIKGAGWAPLYDARLKTDDGAGKAKLDLVRRAVITQRTSEEWTDVKLSLSTTNPTGQTKAPELYAWLIDFKQDRKVGGIMDMMSASEAPAPASEMDRRVKTGYGAGRALKMQKVAAKPKAAVVNSGQFQMTFNVEGLTSVARNGEKKKVFLDQLSIVPDVKLLTVPKRMQKAFLHASFVNKTGDALIPGAVSLFRDGVYVGRSRMAAIEPEQKAEIGFGIDPNVNVKWVRLDRVKGKTGLITSSNSDVRRYKVTIVNGHKKDMDVTVLDQMPYSEAETIEVSLLNANPKPTRSDVDDKRGVMAWDLKVAAQKTSTIEFGYQVVWPKNKSITLR